MTLRTIVYMEVSAAITFGVFAFYAPDGATTWLCIAGACLAAAAGRKDLEMYKDKVN